jgi:hypothetical protein
MAPGGTVRLLQRWLRALEGSGVSGRLTVEVVDRYQSIIANLADALTEVAAQDQAVRDIAYPAVRDALAQIIAVNDILTCFITERDAREAA